MNVYAGRHPVFVSHAKEVEQLLTFSAGLQDRLSAKGKDKGEQYESLVRLRARCADLLLKMYAEDSEVILLDRIDYNWIVLIVAYVRDVLQKDHQIAGYVRSPGSRLKGRLFLCSVSSPSRKIIPP